MKIVVQGLWHLGCVTAACCAQHHSVVGLDFDEAIVRGLVAGRAPLFEPGLDELIAAGISRSSLTFTTDPAQACAAADLLWLCYDTPVDDNDRSDIQSVLTNLKKVLSHLPPGALVLISSQLPVGTCSRLESQFPGFHFAYSPENLRLGKAIEAFTKAERIIVGQRNAGRQDLLQQLLEPFTSQIIFMRTESAEMVKHALNAFLAVSVTFINEIARLCEHTGADAKEVAAGLKSDVRIGPRAYLGPGGPFAGGTLARDVVTLIGLGQELHENVPLLAAIKQSNDEHRRWNFERLQFELGTLRGKTITVLGLTYKPGTNTLRRSAAVELCQELTKAGAVIRAADPIVKNLSQDLSNVTLISNPIDAIRGADAVVVCTEWPEFRRVNWPEAVQSMKGRLILDANGFLRKELKEIPGVDHVCVGTAQPR
ncbi:MAG TPA: nucleotide sugar dehydrogenase [Verrucomicrobiae bacterium]|nr:nucleotide sugar dehydrogenase [Verrucomicrobiae bacterium]